MDTPLLVLDLVGTFVFALSGAMAGVKNRLDLFGVLVLSCAAGNAGGIARDLLIGAVPPTNQDTEGACHSAPNDPKSSPAGAAPVSPTRPAERVGDAPQRL